MRKNIQTKNFIKQFFTSNEHPFNLVKWKKFKITLSGYENFPEVEFPEFYSQNAVNIVATKYFKVVNGKQETSLKELISRVVKTFKKWGQEQGYFDSKTAEIYEKELTYIILHQYATFNSPVWFNVGVPGRSQQCSACQPYRSLVSTPFGFIPIGRIVEERLVGLPVYDSKGITFVTGVKENGFKEVYKIYLKNGLYIEATGDHLVKVSDVYDRDGNKFKWLRVDELKPGMRLYVHFHNVFSEKTYPVEKNVDANQIIYCQSANSSVLTKSKIEIRYSNLQKLIDEAALAGWLQGDGFVGKYSSGTNKSWIIEFMAVNEEQLNYLLPKIEKVFEGVHYKVRETFTKTGRKIWRIRLYGNKLKNFIEKYDLAKRREDMRVPQILFSAPKEAVVSYLESFFDCEGYVSFRKDKKHNYQNSRIGAATISKNLMEDVLILLTGLGIYAKLYRKKEKRQNRQDTYCINITYGNSKKLFAELIGFISKEKIEKLNFILNEFKHKNHNPFRNEEIVKIEKLGVEKVYDIQTLSGEYLSNNVAIHNCFILDVEDNMESILDWIKTEGMIFKGGSGSGVNLSKLRGKGEKLSTGGASSGVISFMRAADAVAGSIKSGGATRRAAKMVILNADHPEIMDFIRVKAEEENKVRALMEAGYDMTDMNNPLWQNIFFQNANNSVRIPDALMEAAMKDGEWKTYYRTTGEVAQTYKAKDILWEIAKAAWECGDPGVQFDDIIQKWHTCKNSGKIEATNPCVTGDTLIATAEGWKRIKDLVGKNPEIITHQGVKKAVKVFKTGIKPVYRIKTKAGYELKVTEDHPIYVEGKGDVKVKDLKIGDKVKLIGSYFGKESLDKDIAFMIGYFAGDGAMSFDAKRNHYSVFFTGGEEDIYALSYIQNTINQKLQYKNKRNVSLRRLPSEYVVTTGKENVAQIIDEYFDNRKKIFKDKIFDLDKESIKYILQGLFTADGTITGNPEKGFYVGLDNSSLGLLKQVQILLLNFGIKAKIYENRRKTLVHYLPDSQRKLKLYKVKNFHSLRITRSSRIIFENEIGFYFDHSKSEKLEKINQTYEAYKDKLFDEIKEIKFEGIEEVYDLTEPETSHFVANGILVHNCSEYIFLNWTSCNLVLLIFLNS
jgi:ribonucleoside-diphosphate reductase alpha chain